MSQPHDLARKFTDEQLRADLLAGMKPAEIARKHGVSRAAVTQRVKRLELTTTSAVNAPVEAQRFVGAQIDVIAQLSKNLARANLLMDACDEWLRQVDEDGKPTGKYDIGPRADEVLVTVTQMQGDRAVNVRRPLSYWLTLIDGADGVGAVDRSDSKHADPRELILKTQTECRQAVALYADLLQKLMDYRVLESWRNAVVEEIAKESDECAGRIAERLERSIVLHAAFAGPSALQAAVGRSS